jgi:chloramphenicol-sensitive protein RarD
MNKTWRSGTWLTIASYILWGILPIWWKLLKTVASSEILANRILWSCLIVNFLVLIDPARRAELRSVLATRRRLLALLGSAVLITANWFVYIVAVNTGNIVETSLGYYINPILSMVIGFLLLREKADKAQVLALSLVAAAVAIATLYYGRVPFIALALAVTFGFYGYVKKRIPVSGLVSLGIETAVAAPFALVFLFHTRAAGSLAFLSQGPGITALLVFSGVVTALPLVLFAEGARRIPLSRVGFIQYLSPTISLLIGIFVYREAFSLVQAMSFLLIWIAIAIYMATRKRANRGSASAEIGNGR